MIKGTKLVKFKILGKKWAFSSFLNFEPNQVQELAGNLATKESNGNHGDGSSRGRLRLTLAGVGVASFGRPPGQVVVEVLTQLTVQTLGVMVAHTSAVNLQKGWKGACSRHQKPLYRTRCKIIDILKQEESTDFSSSLNMLRRRNSTLCKCKYNLFIKEALSRNVYYSISEYKLKDT